MELTVALAFGFLAASLMRLFAVGFAVKQDKANLSDVAEMAGFGLMFAAIMFQVFIRPLLSDFLFFRLVSLAGAWLVFRLLQGVILSISNEMWVNSAFRDGVIDARQRKQLLEQNQMDPRRVERLTTTKV